METYRHTQVGYATLSIVGVVLVASIWRTVRTSEPGLIAVAVLLAIVLILFSTLTVVIENRDLRVYFGVGLIHRRIPLHRIREVRVVTTPWYYGWGIRLTPKGWLWNVSGLRGVELELEDGKRFRIGSDEPERLAEAVRRGLTF